MEQNQAPVRKQRILSGIQPTGTPTLGNYIGAMRNWKLLEDEYECLYMVADLHTITSRLAYPLWHLLVSVIYQLGVPLAAAAVSVTVLCFLSNCFIHLEVGEVLAELFELFSVIALHFNEMVDVGAVDKSVFDCLEVIEFTPNISTVSLRAFGGVAQKRKDHIVAAFLVDACHCVRAVFCAKPSTLINKASCCTLGFFRNGEGTAVP